MVFMAISPGDADTTNGYLSSMVRIIARRPSIGCFAGNTLRQLPEASRRCESRGHRERSLARPTTTPELIDSDPRQAGYSEDIQRLVLLNRWKSGVCVACFDELAEKGGIAYSFEDLEALSWNDRGPPSRRGSRRR